MRTQKYLPIAVVLIILCRPTGPKLVAFAQATGDGCEQSSIVKEAFAPRYPRVALAAQVQGVVALKTSVARDGHVTDAEVRSGNPLLAPTALSAVKRWSFTACRNERSVDVEFQFEALPSNTSKDQIGAVYVAPTKLIIRDVVPVIPDSRRGN